jgi:hypothetical protein
MQRRELYKRIELLRKKIEEGKIHISEHLIDEFRESISKVRILEDGLVDPKSVDGRVRSMCTFIAYEQDRKEWKDAVSLREIQEAYFKRVLYAFGQLNEVMIKGQGNPYQFSSWLCSDSNRVNDVFPVVEEFTSEIFDFWSNIS